MQTDLVKRETLAVLVGTYQLASLEIEQAFTLLEQAQTRLRQAYLDNPGYRFDVNPRNLNRVGEDAIKQVMEQIKKDAWSVILDRMEIRRLLSIKRRNELDQQISTGDGLPDVTEENILAMFESSAANLKTYLDEAVLEVFEILRPPGSHYKTNTEFEVGKRVILSYAVALSWGRSGRFRASHSRDKNLTALDNVFSMLDGKGPVKSYYGPLCDAIADAPDGVGETAYFKFRCYQNQNLHLEFTRLDLVARLNAIAGGNRLKGEKR